MSSKRRIVPELLSWFVTNARDLPWRRTRDPYAVWVSEIMLQQTQVKTVIPYWERWMRELPNIRALANASSDTIHKLWEGLGYYTRVRNLQKGAQQIESLHGGQFPESFDAVLQLSGIGRYTAGAICSIAFNRPTPILDGNVIRVLTRVYGIGENPRDKETNTKLWSLAQELVTHAGALKKQFVFTQGMQATGNCSLLNQSLMELGALICTPRQPKCGECPVSKHCVAVRENRVESLPNLEKRAAATARRFLALVVEHKGKYLVRQRPAGVVNSHLWEFPNHEVTEPNASTSQLAEELLKPIPRSSRREEAHFNLDLRLRITDCGLKESVLKYAPLCTIRHSITRYRITLEAFQACIEGEIPVVNENHFWKSLQDLECLAFTSAHGKILSKLSKKS